MPSNIFVSFNLIYSGRAKGQRPRAPARTCACALRPLEADQGFGPARAELSRDCQTCGARRERKVVLSRELCLSALACVSRRLCPGGPLAAPGVAVVAGKNQSGGESGRASPGPRSAGWSGAPWSLACRARACPAGRPRPRHAGPGPPARACLPLPASDTPARGPFPPCPPPRP